MKINLTKITFFEITDTFLKNLVKEHIGIDYDFIAEEEKHNGYTPFYSIDNETSHFSKIIDHKKGYKNSLYGYVILEHLCFMGILKPGNYLIDHSW
ncbi:MAG: hypothetical protein M0P14_00810 [Alkaliphilus sp.]|nr:hypothetical protein [Alkaliphilus sp.]